MLISYASFEIKHRVDVSPHLTPITHTKKEKQKQPKASTLRSAPGPLHSHPSRTIFYSSLGFAGNLTDHSAAHIMGAHLQTEAYLASLTDTHNPTGLLTYTSIREGLYTESFSIYTAWLDPARPSATNEVTIPHPGHRPGACLVKHDELGEATAKLIVNYTTHPEQFPYINDKALLTGPREISLAEAVDILGRIIGRSLLMSMWGCRRLEIGIRINGLSFGRSGRRLGRGFGEGRRGYVAGYEGDSRTGAGRV